MNNIVVFSGTAATSTAVDLANTNETVGQITFNNNLPGMNVMASGTCAAL